MQASVLHLDSAAGRGNLRLGKVPWADTSWLVRLAVCANPSCGCPDVELECIPEGPISGDRRQGFRFWLDVEKRELFHGGDPMPPPESLAFGAAVAAELGEVDWLALSECLRETKARQLRESAGHEGTFPPEVLSGEVFMVGYAEIFPRASGFEFQIDSENWLADDQYCVNPECRCREALLSFIPLSDEAPPESIPDAPAAFYDYKRARFTPAHEPSGQPALAELFRLLRQAHPNLELQLKQRHLEMRTLYRQALQNRSEAESGDAQSETASGITSPAPVQKDRSAKAGRNDPCPCGSGRKYKKCCGR